MFVYFYMGSLIPYLMGAAWESSGQRSAAVLCCWVWAVRLALHMLSRLLQCTYGVVLVKPQCSARDDSELSPLSAANSGSRVWHFKWARRWPRQSIESLQLCSRLRHKNQDCCLLNPRPRVFSGAAGCCVQVRTCHRCVPVSAENELVFHGSCVASIASRSLCYNQ